MVNNKFIRIKKRAFLQHTRVERLYVIKYRFVNTYYSMTTYTVLYGIYLGIEPNYVITRNNPNLL